MSLDAEKRDRIINAAMKEFLNGYKKASTDAIVHDAGISKGLLFHYFGTKEKLYDFTLAYAYETVHKELYGRLDTTQRDILERLWQMLLLKGEISYRYPLIFDFLTKAYTYTKNEEEKDRTRWFRHTQQKAMDDIFQNFDKSLFKDGLDPDKAARIFWWTLVGYAESQMDENMDVMDYQRNQARYMEDIKAYCDIFHRYFYKENQEEAGTHGPKRD